jgi:hypothetical protein
VRNRENAKSVLCRGSLDLQNVPWRLWSARGMICSGLEDRDRRLWERTWKATVSRGSYPMNMRIGVIDFSLSID